MSKVLEKVMSNQIKNYLEKYNVLPVCQSGFRLNHSCETTLLNITDDIISATDNEQFTVLVLLDFTKAFDTIDHDLLLAILKYIGFHRDALKLMSDYLVGRTQAVILDSEMANPLLIKCGVPQGSILGPLLFSIYTSVFTTHISYCKYHFYADDTQLYISFDRDNVEIARRQLNKDIQQLVSIAKRHSLNINPAKSQAMLFGKPKIRDEIMSTFDIYIDNVKINFSNCCKNLGVLLDTSLRFREHVSAIIQKAYASLKLIYSNREMFTQKVKVMLCESLVLSKFNYCDALYDSCIDSKDIKRIQLVQNSCLRLIFGIRKYQRISHKLQSVPWLNMKLRRIIHKTCVYHKIIVNKVPAYLYNKIRFRTDVHNINLRNKNIITPPQHKYSFFERSFQFCIAKVYNSVPNSYKKLSVSQFKRHLKKVYFEQQQNEIN